MELDRLVSVDPSRVQIDDLPPNPERVLEALASLKGRCRSETLLVYYAGHGATDRQRGHFLMMQSGDLRRADLLKAMKETGAQLVVLLTDCCSTAGTLRPGRPVYGAPYKQLPPHAKVMKDLLFLHSGTVDINASTYYNDNGIGETEWYVRTPNQFNISGGIFTYAMSDVIKSRGSSLDRDGDDFIAWSEVFPEVAKCMDFVYSSLRRRALAEAGEAAEGDDIATLKLQSGLHPQQFGLGTQIK